MDRILSVSILSFVLYCNVISVGGQLSLSRGMCNFDPCVKEPVAARCEVDVSYVGVALCICPDGFVGDGKPPANGGTGCQQQNECLIGNHDCDLENQICEDKDPVADGIPYECRCKPGYGPSASGRTCNDVDECLQPSLNLCEPETTMCRNLPGSYECVCKNPNHRFEKNTASCQAINPCEDLNGRENPCDEKTTFCHNRGGVAECVCRTGYQPDPMSKTSCADIDECVLELDQCDKKISRCQNEVGDYACICREELGYTTNKENRKMCQNLDECDRWPMICPEETPCCADLLPEQGGYQCSPIMSSPTTVRRGDPLSIPDPSQSLPDNYYSKQIEMLLAQAALYQNSQINAKPLDSYLGEATLHQYPMNEAAIQQLLVDYLRQNPAAANTLLAASRQAEGSMLKGSHDYSTGQAAFQLLHGHAHDPLRRLNPAVEHKGAYSKDGLRGHHHLTPAPRKLQGLFTRMFHGAHAGSPVGGGPLNAGNLIAGLPVSGAFRLTESAMCPAGFRHRQDISKIKAREKTVDALRTTFAGTHKATPDQVANGIVTNAGVLANEFASWYNSLASVPSQVAVATQNATRINPAGDAAKALQAGEQIIAPFTGGGLVSGTYGAPPALSGGELGLLAAGGGAGAAIGAVAGGAAVGAAVKGGPGDSWIMDRTGTSRKVAYDRF